MIAAEKGYAETAGLLLGHEKGRQNSLGETALMRAAAFGRIDIVRLLIPREAGIFNKEGHCALVVAMRNERDEAASLLLREFLCRDSRG